MPQNDTPKPSFSGGRRWLSALNTILAATATLAIVVMLNYLATGHFWRFQLSRDAAFKLSQPTKNVLESLTNEVKITKFFQPDGDNQEIYGLTSALLTEYQNANPKYVHVTLLDYTRYAGAAKELLARCNLTGPRQKDFVLFECNGHQKTVDAKQMADYDFGDLMAGKSKYVRRNAFRGELLFTSDIFAVSHPQSLKTYFLHGHGERDPDSSDSKELPGTGFAKLAAILKDGAESHFKRGHPLSPDLYVLVDGAWQVHVPEDQSLRDLWLALKRRRDAIDYAQQQELLNAIHQKEGIDLFVASYKVHERKDGLAYSVCVWSNGVDSSLPHAENIAFMVDPEGGDHFVVGWDAAVAIVGDLLEQEPELVPPRYRVREFPDAEQITKLRRLVG